MPVLENIDTTLFFTAATSLSDGERLVSISGWNTAGPTWSCTVTVQEYGGAAAFSYETKVIMRNGQTWQTPQWLAGLMANKQTTCTALGDRWIAITPDTGTSFKYKFRAGF